MTRPFFHSSAASADPQRAPPCARCARCLGELYPEDSLYYIEGDVLCEDCLPEFAADYFAPQHMTAAELAEQEHI